jgi:hypothetical protein
MVETVTGIYEDGSIRLLETPTNIPEGLVTVTLDATITPPEPRYLQPGKYPGEPTSTLEDFKITEWHGEREFDDL